MRKDKAKPVIPRGQARLDVDDALDYYLTQASQSVARGFIDALEQGYRHISRFPASGSPRYAQELDLPGLRIWGLSDYPLIIFYVEREDHVDVWRVLH
ncbi:MAG: type II toxin-antitoxin system RelE/ParE family toxin, partial [Alcaligenaceae bacterium]|nr:type II toxin-antitoxin system RelE/ParE family toxin [Alcaligenaceae bacterium]